ncbi:Crp/Fnr family transcriptional regulator [Robertkochia aurantiaca]|uniref:Crp/Fnr family transcriptional regulator n=1 Tax=Robertkochia aurantiaca TaxID=2873700 RepID=UPI001CCDDD3F|nr:Crp/Fnr family transcriptional regulator [Robertkochia sp. 3YJGBD-33]
MSALWFFQEVDLFQILCPHKYTAFRECHKMIDCSKNDYIYFEKDLARTVYLVESGKIRIGYYTEEGEEIVKAILTRGEIFGEKALLDGEARNEFAQSVTKNTRICSVSVESLQQMMRDDESFSLKIYKFIGYRYRKLERRLRLLLFKDTRTRLLEFIDELFKEYGNENDGIRLIRHPYTQKDIASLIGTSRQTLNTLMNELREAGMIDFSRQEIRLLKSPLNVN